MSAREVARAARGHVKKWRRILGLSANWEITVKVHATESDAPEDERDCAAYVTYEEGYFDAEISLNPWSEMFRRERLEALVIHELLHLVLAPLSTPMKAALLPSGQTELIEALDEGRHQRAAARVRARARVAAVRRTRCLARPAIVLGDLVRVDLFDPFVGQLVYVPGRGHYVVEWVAR